jgi:Recombinase
LNRDGIGCPSARRPEQNRHRLADGWQGSTVHAILENPRYTGYAVFGRWTKIEKLADPDDVAAGHVVRFERAAPDRIVPSRQLAHPAIVSVADFTRVQVERRARSSQGMRGIAARPRTGATEKRPYLLRGRVQCAICHRKMQGGSVRHHVYYRCTARSLAPGAAALAEHPKTVNLREDILTGAINGWIGGLFSPEHRDDTVRALVDSQGGPAASAQSEDARTRLKDAEEALRRLQAAIVAGIDPAAIKEAVNAAQAQREAARAALAAVPPSSLLDVAEVYAMIDALGDVGEVIKDARPDSLTRIYRELGIKVSYRHEDSGGEAVISLVVANREIRCGWDWWCV